MERNALPKNKGTPPLIPSGARKRIGSGDRRSKRGGVARQGSGGHGSENHRRITVRREQQDRQARQHPKRGRRARADSARTGATLARPRPVVVGGRAQSMVMLA